MNFFRWRKSIVWSFVFLMVNVHIYAQERGDKMDLRSDSFENNAMIGSKYTCDGSNITPHLAWANAPAGTKSFALSCNDPDAPVGNFIHWLVYNIPADVDVIPENGHLPSGAVEVMNDFSRLEYGGPCPPSGTHRYYFTVYALDTGLSGITDKNDFFRQVKAHAIDKAVIMGKYTRRR